MAAAPGGDSVPAAASSERASGPQQPLCIVDRSNFLYQACDLVYVALLVVLYQTGALVATTPAYEASAEECEAALRAAGHSQEQRAAQKVLQQAMREARRAAAELVLLSGGSPALCHELCSTLLDLPLFEVRPFCQ